MIRFLINTKDNGIYTVDTLTSELWVRELFENREFESLKQVQDLMRVVNPSQFALERGLRCPKDAHEAIKTIKSLPKFQPEMAVVTSKESGKKVYDDCRELMNQGRILYRGAIEEPCTGRNFWQAEVVTGIKYVKEA